LSVPPKGGCCPENLVVNGSKLDDIKKDVGEQFAPYFPFTPMQIIQVMHLLVSKGLGTFDTDFKLVNGFIFDLVPFNKKVRPNYT
jgi:hypothetical protein